MDSWNWDSAEPLKKPAKTTIISLANNKAGKLTVTWKQKSKISGYHVQYAEDKAFKGDKTTRTVNKYTNTSYTFSGLEKGKTYYVRVRTYNGSKRSSWSAVKKIIITK